MLSVVLIIALEIRHYKEEQHMGSERGAVIIVVSGGAGSELIK